MSKSLVAISPQSRRASSWGGGARLAPFLCCLSCPFAVLPGCKGKEEAAYQPIDLTQRLPESTFGIFAIRTNDPSISKQYAESPNPLPDTLSFADGTDYLEAMVKAFAKSGLYPTRDNPQSVVEQVLVGISDIGGGKAALVMLGQGPKLKGAVDKFLAEMEAAGFPAGEAPNLRRALPNGVASTFVTKGKGSDDSSTTVYLAATESLLGFSTDELVLASVFSGTTTTPAVLARTDLKEFITTRLNSQEVPLFGAIDLARAMPEEREAGLRSARFERRGSAADGDTFWLDFEPGSTAGEALAQIATAPSTFAPLSLGSENSLLVMGFDGNMVRQALRSIPQAASFADNLADIQGLSAQVAYQPTQSPFPIVTIQGLAVDPAATLKKFEAIGALLVGATNLDALPWQQEMVDGKTVRGISSPAGYGIYLAADAKHFYVSSALAGVREALAATSGKAGTLGSSLAEKAQSKLGSSSGHFAYHIDFPRLAEAITAFAPMLSVAIGTNVALKAEHLATLKQLGKVSGLGNISSSSIAISQAYQ